MCSLDKVPDRNLDSCLVPDSRTQMRNYVVFGCCLWQVMEAWLKATAGTLKPSTARVAVVFFSSLPECAYMHAVNFSITSRLSLSVSHPD